MTRFVLLAAALCGTVALTSCNTTIGTDFGMRAAVGGPGNAAPSTGEFVGVAISEREAARSGPPPAKGYPLARPAGEPGFYYSPYTGRVYNLRSASHRALIRDADTGRIFRKP